MQLVVNKNVETSTDYLNSSLSLPAVNKILLIKIISTSIKTRYSALLPPHMNDEKAILNEFTHFLNIVFTDKEGSSCAPS